MRRLVQLAVAAGLAAVGAAAGQDGPVPLKVKKAGTGDAVRETKSEEAVTKTTVGGPNGPKTNTDQTRAKFVYTDAVGDRPAGAAKPTKVRRAYEAAELTTAGKAQDLGLAGKTVLIEKAGDRYQFTFAGGGPVGEQAAGMLAKEFGPARQVTEEDFLPKGPVKPGDTWQVPVAKPAADLADSGLAVDAAKSTGTGKLLKLYRKDGRLYGTLQVRLDLAVAKVGETPAKDGSKMAVTLDLDVCVDGTETAGRATTAVDGRFAIDAAPNVPVTIELTAKTTTTAAEVKK